MSLSIYRHNVGPQLQVHCFEQKPRFDYVNITCQTRTLCILSVFQSESSLKKRWNFGQMAAPLCKKIPLCVMPAYVYKSEKYAKLHFPCRFSQTCELDFDGEVTCTACPQGYTGRRCQRCAPGYEGDPTRPGDSCRLSGGKIPI